MPIESEMFNRSVPLLTEAGLTRISECQVVVAGCGGVGGAMAVTLCRMGVKKFRLADPGVFDPPDANRQIGATGSTMGRNKALVYSEMILDINPLAEIEVFPEGVTENNQGGLLESADIVIDCLDASVPYELREQLHREARERQVFSVVAPIMGFGCFAICSSPEGVGMDYWTELLRVAREQGKLPDVFDEVFVPQHLSAIVDSLKSGRVPTVAVGPLLATSLLATECINHLLYGLVQGYRKPIVLPEAMFFDLNRMNYRVIDVSDFGRSIMSVSA